MTPALTPPYPVDTSVWPPVWTVDADGFAQPHPGHGDTVSTLMAAGQRVFPTLAGAVLYGGAQASAFHRPLKAEPVYDGMQALMAGSVRGLTPVGVRASYKIVATPEGLRTPPTWPGDMP